MMIMNGENPWNDPDLDRTYTDDGTKTQEVPPTNPSTPPTGEPESL
jgi:hypothetical protein